MPQSIITALRYSWGFISAALTWIILNHIWPSIKKWLDLKDEISTSYTQYGNLKIKFHTESETPEFGKDALGQKIVGPTYEYQIVDNESQLEEAAHHLKKLAGRLRALKDSTIGYNFLAFIHLLPNAMVLAQTSKALIEWANDIDSPLAGRTTKFIHQNKLQIQKLLNLTGE